jgi:hypothetical protein
VLRRVAPASIIVVSIAAALIAVGLATVPAAARAAAPVCAQTTDPNTPAAPTPGSPCWTDVSPYPFGVDGNPVTAASASSTCPAEPAACYMKVTSLAFRAWNRGLAATAPAAPANGAAPFGVWLYNGTRWYPDPTFPGSSTCPGSKVLWAGKLDYWLVGAPAGAPANTTSWPSLCRFDGANFEWEPLSVPRAVTTANPTGAITSGSCFAFNNCWFFGTGGVVLHWDGQTLTDESLGLGSSPWLEGGFMDALNTTLPDGQAVGLAVALKAGQPQPNGAPPPQLFSSSGGPFAPTSFAPASPAGDGTDLVAASFDSNGSGWVAGDPAGIVAAQGTAWPDFVQPFNTSVVGLAAQQPSPLQPVSASGSVLDCPGTPADNFMYSGSTVQTSYLWSSVGVMPDASAVAGGLIGSSIGGGGGTFEPILARVSCTAPPQLTQFRIPDPNPFDPPGSTVPANPDGFITSVAASATNDVWAASAGGNLVGPAGPVTAPPHLYQLTDGQTPLAPAGNDDETRPVVVQPEPTIFVLAPPVVIPPPPVQKTKTKRAKTKHKKIKLSAPLYDISKPKLHSRPDGTFTLSITCKVRRKVKIELEALHGKRVVSRSGMKTFTGRAGTLTVTVTRKLWPTGLKFVEPHGRH